MQVARRRTERARDARDRRGHLTLDERHRAKRIEREVTRTGSGGGQNSLQVLYAGQGQYEKARQSLGWSPRTSFGEGLERLVSWYRDNAGWARLIETGA